jgi:hypothetical protein
MKRGRESRPLYAKREGAMWLSETIGRISSRITEITAKRSRGETRDLVIEHELAGVNPEMIDWWWDNIDDSQRYALWHPGSHISFTWEIREDGEHVGRTHRVLEKIGPIPTILRIRWEETGAVSVPLEYDHVNTASTLDRQDHPMSWVVHQYETMEGGTRMRSTFRLPGKTPGWFAKALRKHNVEEMSRFTVFLPELYERETGPGS